MDVQQTRTARDLEGRNDSERFSGWKMALLVFLCTNVGSAMTFGIYGVFMGSMIQEYQASRSIASAGASIAIAGMGVFGAVAGYMVRRWSVRLTMSIGFLCLSAAWTLMGLSQNAQQYVLAYGFLAGAAMGCLLVVPPIILVNNWFIRHRGRATALVTTPLLLTVSAPLAAGGIGLYGWRSSAEMIALLPLAMAGVAWLIVDHPKKLGQKPLGWNDAPQPDLRTPITTTRADQPLTRDPRFWVLMSCTGILGGSSLILSTHLIPFATGIGYDLKTAALLASIYSITGLVSGLLGGSLADRIGGDRAFILIAVLECIAWPCLLLQAGFGFLVACIVVIGMCAHSMIPVATSVFVAVFGRDRFPRVMSLFPIVTLPFKFLLPLLAGGIYDVFGSYNGVFLICAVLFISTGFIIPLTVRKAKSPGAPLAA